MVSFAKVLGRESSGSALFSRPLELLTSSVAEQLFAVETIS